MSLNSSPTDGNENDLLNTIQAKIDLKTSDIIVPDTRSQDQLRSKGYGEMENKRFILMSYEALYLSHIAKLVLLYKSAEMKFEELLSYALKKDSDIFTKFLIYRDLRSRGYTVKEGFGFGIDFRVYERGEYGKKSAKFVVFGINEGTSISTSDLAKKIFQIEKMGKDGIIAVIERRGEVIYYKLNQIRFHENKNNSNNNSNKEEK